MKHDFVDHDLIVQGKVVGRAGRAEIRDQPGARAIGERAADLFSPPPRLYTALRLAE